MRNFPPSQSDPGMRGVTGETLLEEAVTMTTRWGLVKPNDHIVCIQQIHDSFVIKIVSVDDAGAGIKDIRPESLVNLIQVCLMCFFFTLFAV